MSAPSLSTSWLVSVWGSGPTDVWAVGEGGTILHYDGGTWTDMSDPSLSTSLLWSVWGNRGRLLNCLRRRFIVRPGLRTAL